MSPTAVHPALRTALDLAQGALEEYQAAERDCVDHAAQKCLVRSGAILRIMQEPAPSGKAHSWSSAEALRDLDPKYAEYKAHEAELAALRAQKEFALWAARERASYLGRTLPPTALEDLVGPTYGCIHGVPIDRECSACDAGQEIVR